MACHYRVAAKDAKVGQPEVNLGIIPGAGRHAAAAAPRGRRARARDVHGRQAGLGAAKAHAAGIVDEVVEGDLLAGAIAFAKARAAAGRAAEDARDRVRRGGHGRRGSGRVRERPRVAHGRASPRRCAAIDAIEAALTLAFDAGLGPRARAVRRLRRLDRVEGAAPPVLRRARGREGSRTSRKDTPTLDVERAAVIGAGTMGGGIAMSYANAGIPVLLKEVGRRGAAARPGDDPQELRVARSPRAASRTTRSSGRWRSSRRPRPTTDSTRVDIVVEAVFENMDLKKQTFAELGRVTRPDCVLASNTSTLDIDEFAQASGRPAQVIGHHFFSPANVMKLLEIVRGRETSASVIATSVKLGKRLAQGAGRRRQLLRLRRQPHARVLHARGVPAARGRRSGRADRPRAHGLRPAGRPVRHAGHRGHRRGRAHPAVPRVDRQDARGGPAVGGAGPAVRDGPLRAEDRRRLVPLRARQPRPHSRSAGRAARRGSRGEARHHAPAGVRTTRSSRGSRRRSRTRARACSRTASPSARATSTSSTATASASRGTAADPCSTRTRSACPRSSRACASIATRFGDYWKPAPLLERLVAEGRALYQPDTDERARRND